MAKRKHKPNKDKKFDLFKYDKKPSQSSPMFPGFPELPKPVKEEPLTPIEERWQEFEAADYEAQIALCQQTIDEELMDDEMAFEMFNTIYYATAEHEERHRFEELAQKLRERLPDVFDQEAHYILDWQLTNALAEGRQADILPLARELGPKAGQHIDPFIHTLDMLDYHNQLPVLLEIMPIAWPTVKERSNIFDWAIDEFAERAADYVVFDALERNPNLEAADPDLQEKLGFYLETINQEFFARFLDYLTGRVSRSWTMADFGFERQTQGQRQPSKTAKLSDEAKQNLFDLTLEFLYYLRHEENIPLTKGRLARRKIFEYLLERHAGELEPRESMFEAMSRPAWQKPPKPKVHPPEHWLCPDRSTFDHFLANLLGFLSGRYYEATVTFELTPAWLRFLESRQLIDAGLRTKTGQALLGLDTELFKVLAKNSDPALSRAIEHWREYL